MRCQRCGFELEAGQTFCPMCGTEQSRAQRSKKWKPKSILWVIKIASKAHMWMWLALFCSLTLLIVTSVVLEMTPLNVSCICLESILVAYELFNILLGYKNPNATKTKAYKIRYKLCFIFTILLLMMTLFLDFSALAKWVNETILGLQGK